jgi:hypothetical protein
VQRRVRHSPAVWDGPDHANPCCSAGIAWQGQSSRVFHSRDRALSCPLRRVGRSATPRFSPTRAGTS